MTTAATTTTASISPSILAVVDWDHKNRITNEETTSGLSKIRLENGSLPLLVERIRQELLVHHGDANNIMVEISIYDAKTNNHRVIHRDEMSMGQESVVASDPAIPLHSKQPQEEDSVDEDLTRRYGRRWRLCVVCMQEKKSQEHKQHRPLLAIQGRSYHHENLVIAGKTLYIQERWNDPSNQTAFTVWDASLVLARYLEENQSLVRGKNVLELGAGCGVAGMAAACCAAESVILTDRSEIIPHLQANIDANLRAFSVQDVDSTAAIKSSLPTITVTCQTLDWFQPSLSSSLAWRNGGNVDVILVSDCVWTMDLVEPLLNTLHVLTELPSVDTQRAQSQSSDSSHLESSNQGKTEILNRKGNGNGKGNDMNSVVLVAYQRRGLATHQAFWKGLRNLFQVETLPSPSLQNDPETSACSSKIDLVQCVRKMQ